MRNLHQLYTDAAPFTFGLRHQNLCNGCTNKPKERTMKTYLKPKATPIRLPAALGAESSAGGGGGWNT